MKTSLIPFRLSHLSKSSSTGRDPIGMSGFGKMDVYGRNRVPVPPHWITAFILILLYCQSGKYSHLKLKRASPIQI
jgi:hypothetical protein